MINKPTLFSTLQLVHNLYKDKVDKQGTPYIVHLLNVMFACTDDDDIRMVALLHDVLEDNVIWFDDLSNKLGYSDTIIHEVDILSRLPNESYFDYIKSIKRMSIIATKVKIADLQDNLAKCNSPQFDSLKQRYEKALAILKDEIH